MNPIVGVFDSSSRAEVFIERARRLGVRPEHMNLFLPCDPDRDEVAREVPTTDAEQPGVAATLGGLIGGTTGVFAGLGVIGTVLLPGIGTAAALGTALALGAAGAVGGATAGAALDSYLGTGLPADEVYVYEDALRQGKTVVFIFDEEKADEIRELMHDVGAESIDAAREQRWVGVGDAANEEYRGDADQLSAPSMRRSGGPANR